MRHKTIGFAWLFLIIAGLLLSGCEILSQNQSDETLNDETAIATDLASLSIGLGENPSLSAVVSDLSLANSGASGSIISWISSEPSMLSANGQVKRPCFDDQSLILTATISKGNASASRIFTVTVLAFGYAIVVYDGNSQTGGTAPQDGNHYTASQLVSVMGNTGDLTGPLIYDGINQRFVGWHSDSESTTALYTAGDSFEIQKSITLFAIYSALRVTGPAGGLIFYDKGDNTGGWQYMEAAPASTDVLRQWGTYDFRVEGTSYELGTGKANTDLILARLLESGESNRAAQHCESLTLGGFTDWFFPSRDELNLMYENLHLFNRGGFGSNGHPRYWSSSARPSQPQWSAIIQWFNNGKFEGANKKNTFNVRATRRF